MAKNKNSSYKNYLKYINGKEKLSNAVLQHPDEPDSDNSVYHYMKGEIGRNIWIMPWEKFNKIGNSDK